jgi:hypothetical protein
LPHGRRRAAEAVSFSFPMISRNRCKASSALPLRHKITRSSARSRYVSRGFASARASSIPTQTGACRDSRRPLGEFQRGIFVDPTSHRVLVMIQIETAGSHRKGTGFVIGQRKRHRERDGPSPASRRLHHTRPVAAPSRPSAGMAGKIFSPWAKLCRTDRYRIDCRSTVHRNFGQQ